MRKEFTTLVSDAEAQEFSGWDFRYVATRMIEERTSWNYRDTVKAHVVEAEAMLDLDTGGGEFLAGIAPLAETTYATEGFAPNVPIAKARLKPLGVSVIEVFGDAPLPFVDGMFDLVTSRHGAFDAREVRRILKPNGHFVTQQVGSQNNIELNDLLGGAVSESHNWSLDSALQEFGNLDFEIEQSLEEFPETVFMDVGAIVFYLKAIPWQVADFEVERYLDRLKKLHEFIVSKGSLEVHAHRFFVVAKKSTR